MTIRSFWLAAASLATLGSGLWRTATAVDAAAPGGAPPSFTTLRPGGFNTIAHRLPINVVFVGYEEGAGSRDIRQDDFLGQLSAGSCTRKRAPSLYGLDRPTGLCFAFDYHTQPMRSRDVTQNHRIDAAAVEAWLGSHGADIGVDTSQYTVFFINWYGRSDFRFHVYDYRAEPDPDTGVDFGSFGSRAMAAWGDLI